MNSKKWIQIVFISSFFSVVTVISLNFIIDPLWLYSYSHGFNCLQSGFDERLQKTIYLKNKLNISEIDTLLFGSSRVTYYNQEKIKNLKVFNYSFSNGTPDEFITYANYAKSIKKDKFDNIIVGLDFIGPAIDNNKQNQQNIKIIDEVNSKYQLIFKYISLDMLRHSIVNIKRSISGTTGPRSYNRMNIAKVDKVKESNVASITKNSLKTLYSDLVFNDSYYTNLKKFQESNKGTNFIVFTTPLSDPILKKIYTNEKLKREYIKWVKNITLIFDKIFFFTLPSDLSKDYNKKSIDGSHYYPETGELILNIILQKERINNYGVILSKDNINEYLKKLNEIDSRTLSIAK